MINGKESKTLDRFSLKNKASVKIDSFFLKNLINGKGKISNRYLRLSLKIDVSKKLYLLLNKWKNDRNSAFFKFETLYNKVPLPLEDDKPEHYRKRRLKDSCTELKEVGFIDDFNVNEEGIDFIFNKSEIKIKQDNLLDKYNIYDEIINQLHGYAITDKIIDRYFKLQDIPYTQALLRFVEDRKDTIGNMTNYVFKGLVVHYENIDKKYYN